MIELIDYRDLIVKSIKMLILAKYGYLKPKTENLILPQLEKKKTRRKLFNKDEKKLHRLTRYIWLQKNDSIKF